MIQIELIENGEYLGNIEGPPNTDYFGPYNGNDIDDVFQQIKVDKTNGQMH